MENYKWILFDIFIRKVGIQQFSVDLHGKQKMTKFIDIYIVKSFLRNSFQSHTLQRIINNKKF
jgi:hypothetical protein